jgi:hypothetical protein
MYDLCLETMKSQCKHSSRIVIAAEAGIYGFSPQPHLDTRRHGMTGSCISQSNSVLHGACEEETPMTAWTSSFPQVLDYVKASRCHNRYYRGANSFCIWRTPNPDSMRRIIGRKDLDYFSTAPWNSD